MNIKKSLYTEASQNYSWQGLLRRGNLNINNLLLDIIIFFIPYTSFKVVGFKISEIVTIILIFFFLLKKRKICVSATGKYVVLMTVWIALSAWFSYFDPINKYVHGVDSGIYYSFELGWLFRVIRIFIVYIFSYILALNLKNKGNYIHYCNVYIFSNFALDIYAIAQSMKSGILLIGVTRTSLMAVEPSEAGFINCFAIVMAIYAYIVTKKKRYWLIVAILSYGQLVIGNTASIIAMFAAIICCVLLYLKVDGDLAFKKIFLLVAVLLVGSIAIYYVTTYTSLLDKVLNYQKYVDVQGASVSERIAAVETCWHLFLNRPILGVGFGNYGWYLYKFVTSSYYNFTPGGRFQPNNLYFQLLAELGLCGFSTFIAFMIMKIKKIYNSLKLSGSSYFYLVFTLITYVLAHGTTLMPFYSFQLWMAIAMIDGAIVIKRAKA